MFYNRFFSNEKDQLNINFLTLLVEYVINKYKKNIYIKYNLTSPNELITLE